MNPRIFNLVILDESGSMQAIKQAAIGSVNETIQTIRGSKKEDPETEQLFTLVTFDSCGVKTGYDCANIDTVEEITDKQYQPNACTPLYDAIGKSVNALRRNVAPNDRVLVTIVTDGYENASQEYTGPAIKALINELKPKGWVFVYMGANHDVESVASTISIHNTMTFHATADGVADMSTRECLSRKKLYDRMKGPHFCSIDEDAKFFDK